jgi:uncharacterized flavoprotein (TIGR03862 family)
MKKSIAIIGGGPAALLCASFLDAEKFDITLYEKNKTLARKFLVAGKGGFNLSHSEPIVQMIERYTPSYFLKDTLLEFDNSDLRDWLETIGIPTFIGSSKRIYPEQGIKPIEVLNSILKVLKKKNVKFQFEHTWTGWDENNYLLFNSDLKVQADHTIFSMGGSSWKKTGSDGIWMNLFQAKGMEVLPFEVSNCAFGVDWKEELILKHEGSPLKNITISCADKSQKGEVVLTRFALEGNAIYALSPQIRQALKTNKKASIFIDFKPTVSLADLKSKFKKSIFKKTSEILKKDLNLSTVQIALLKSYVSKEIFLNPSSLMDQIKHLRIEITSFAQLDEGISTVGGIDLNAVDENFQLKNIPNNYCIGEMLDWDAPTGGYLLQACFSMGVYVARHLNEK